MNCCEQNKPYGCHQGRDCPVRQSTVDGGHQVNGSLSFPLHRQVMPPLEQESSVGDWVWYWVSFFLAIGLVTFIAWSAA